MKTKETNLGGRPKVYQEPTKTFGLMLSERELDRLDELTRRLGCRSKADVTRMLLSLGFDIVENNTFLDYCAVYNYTPGQLFAHIFEVWRTELQRFAPPVDKSDKKYHDLMKLFE